MLRLLLFVEVLVAANALGEGDSIEIGSTTYQLPLKVAVIMNIGCFNATACEGIIGGIGSHEGYFQGPALVLAREDINNDPSLSLFHNLTFDFSTTLGSERKSIDATFEAAKTDVVALIGYQRTCQNQAKVAAVYHKLTISHACGIEDMSVTSNLQTFVQLKYTELTFAHAVREFIRVHGWKKAAFVSTNAAIDVLIFYESIRRNVLNELRSIGVDVWETEPIFQPGRAPRKGDFELNFAKVLMDTYLKTRIYILFGNIQMINWMMDTMGRMGLLQTGKYFVLAILEEPSTSSMAPRTYDYAQQRKLLPLNIRYGLLRYPSLAEIEQNNRAVAVISSYQPTPTPELIRFKERYFDLDKNRREVYCPDPYADTQYCQFLFSTLEQERGGLIMRERTEKVLQQNEIVTPWWSIVNLYDGLMIYVRAASSMWNDYQMDIGDGDQVFERIIRQFYTSVDGHRDKINMDGRVTGRLALLYGYDNKKYGGYTFWPVAEFSYNDSDQWTLNWFSESPSINWLDGKPPVDEPKCGFEGEKCTSMQESMASVIGGCLAAIIVILMLIGAILFRQWRYERALQSMEWKIDRRDLILRDFTNFDSARSATSMNSSVGGSVSSARDFRSSNAKFVLTDYEANIKREEKREAKLEQGNFTKRTAKQAFDDPTERKWLDLGEFSLALHKTRLIGLKRIYKNSVDLSRDVRKELKIIREYRHEHAVSFIGAVHEPPHVFIVSELCPRGALKDILENDDFKLDNMFVASITNDLVRGLIYLHDSNIGAHGRLKSTNCMVDARWVVRLSSFGLRNFRHGEYNDAEDVQEGKDQLWTAPELLRIDPDLYYPTIPELQKSDAFSFGIILHEIYGRRGPYGDEIYEPKEIIEKVQYPEKGNHFRPSMKTVEDAPTIAKELMVDSWGEEPTQRPSFTTIRKRMKPLQKGMKANILDNMIALMEKYTNNLEDVVKERTCQLDEERRKSERLLLMMLPKAVADQLKRGQSVEAEAFESVSIYFSDIVGFTSMSSESTPFEVVQFLNDLYTCFDSIIGNYDVYKVETIGDAYMVVSGLPIQNGLNHAGEIASMSLQLLEAIKTFKVRHRPGDTLKLRIGIHSGPCVTGVVGLKMPRYCLFGDTVNTASRMESNGEALKIHCSGQCKAILDKLGGYDIAERGYIAMKGKGEQLTFWVTGQNDDWRRSRIERESETYPALKKTLV